MGAVLLCIHHDLSNASTLKQQRDKLILTLLILQLSQLTTNNIVGSMISYGKQYVNVYNVNFLPRLFLTGADEKPTLTVSYPMSHQHNHVYTHES